MKFSSLIRVSLLGLAALFSVGVMAEPYARVPGPVAAKDAPTPRGFTNNTTFLQTCTMDVNVQNCVNNGSLGGVYTSNSAYSALSSLGCTYMYARAPLLNKPGLDVYNCLSGSFLGATVFVFLDGVYSNSFAGAITILF